MLSLEKNALLLILAGVALCLLQVWLPGYYLTCDGPCHLYNAQILHDMWCNKNADLYSRFYYLSYRPDPNWLSTFVLALLLFAAKGVIAEKLFLSIYVVLYVTGGWLLLRKLSGVNSYWQLAIFIFLFPLTLAKGFYNFSFSIAFYFWVVWAWLRFLDKRSISSAVIFFVFSGLLFFTHLLPFVFGAVTCACLTLSYAFAEVEGRKKSFLHTGAWLLLLLAPFIVLMFWFTEREGGLQLHLAPHPYRLIELAQFKYIITLTNTEKLPAAIAGSILLLSFIWTLIMSLIGFKIHKYDGFAVALLLIGFVYLFFPEDFMGRAIIISIRTQLFVFILMVCIMSYRLAEGNIKYAGAFLLFICFGWLSRERIRCMAKISTAASDLLFVNNLIKPASVVLPLNFSLEGKDIYGRVIADRNSAFHHAAAYLGVEQPLIVLTNYEANISYFPVKWREEVNPYIYLNRAEGIEGVPPYADMAAYKRETGVDVDYIVLWCYQASFLANSHFSTLFSDIRKSYHLIYTSPGGRTMLYQRN